MRSVGPIARLGIAGERDSDEPIESGPSALLTRSPLTGDRCRSGQIGADKRLRVVREVGWAALGDEISPSGTGTGLGAASNYDSLIAFGQLSSVVNGVIT